MARALLFRCHDMVWEYWIAMMSVAFVPAILLVLGRVALSRSHPEPHEMLEVQRLARELDEAVEQLLQESTYEFRSAAGERGALEGLIALADQVEEFRIRVTASMQAPSETLRDFLRLQSRFAQASVQIPKLSAYRVSGETFGKIVKAMRELRFYYDYDAGVPLKVNARTGNKADTVEVISLQ